MNFSEVLKAHGLTDEAIVKINADMKANKIFLAGEENLDVRYNKLKLESEQNSQELAKAQALIGELQNGTKSTDELKSKIKDYETEVKTLKESLEQQRVETALDRVLIEAKVQDVDYVKFKLREKGTTFKLDENGKLENIQSALDDLKVQLPKQFESADKKVEELKLPESKEKKGITKDDYSKMSYKERLELFNKDKATFEEVSKND